jgi:hypothetical protein
MSATQQVPHDIHLHDSTLTTVPEEEIRERAYGLYGARWPARRTRPDRLVAS